MADSILCSINMAGGAINIYYDTILTQGNLRSNSGSAASTSIPSGWKAVIIMSARYVWNDDNYILSQPFPIFIETSDYIQMPALYKYSNSEYAQSMYAFALVSSNRLQISGYTNVSYIVAA